LELSIVLPAHNEEQHLLAQIEAIIDQDCSADWELVVVDNNSTDGTAALVHEVSQRFPRVRLVQASEQSDKSYAVAAGVETTEAELLVVCDADDIVAPGWLAALAEGLRDHQVVTGPNELDLLNPPWLADSRGRSGDDAVGTYAGIFPCIRGNNYGLRRSVWDSIGPLSQGFYPVEDIEYSHRCWINGIEVVGLPEAIVHYRYRQSVRDLWRQGLKYGAGRVRIARLLRDENSPAPPRLGGWKSWAMLVITVPRVFTAEGRARWTWIAGNRCGQVIGSIRYRTLML
jgi:glycosyltransferase involved in cell wall biosynthesis